MGQQAEIEEPHSSLLDKTFDYLWEKYSYGKDTITFDKAGDGIVEIEPALFYIPQEAWEFNGKSPCAEHPVGYTGRRERHGRWRWRNAVLRKAAFILSGQWKTFLQNLSTFYFSADRPLCHKGYSGLKMLILSSKALVVKGF